MSIQIRPAVPADAPALLAIYAPYVAQTAITFEYDVPTETEFACRIADTLKKYPYLCRWAMPTPENFTTVLPMTGRWRLPSMWNSTRNAVASADCSTMPWNRELRRRHFLNMNACIACPMGESDPYLARDTIRFHDKLGYRMVGEFHQCGYKFGRWYHMVWMEKHIGDHADTPLPVVWG